LQFDGTLKYRTVSFSKNRRLFPHKNRTMKKHFFLLLTLAVGSLYAQQIDYNVKGGAVANGYDVVSYFNHAPKKGSKEFATTYEGAKFLFSSEKNLAEFKANPKKYVPQYGGYCAYAVGSYSGKVKINPETYEIKNGKLYLFYNALGTNTLERWNKEGAEQLRKKADENWEKIKAKS